MTKRNVAEDSIDLTTLIGMKASAAVAQLENWGLAVAPSPEYPGVYSGYDESLQIATKEEFVTTIWVYFLARDGVGAFPYCVNATLKPHTEIGVVRNALGEPSSESDEYGWMKWTNRRCQIHCEHAESKVTMVTLMKPDWQPGE